MKHRVCAEQLSYQVDRIFFFFSLRILHVTVNIVRFALFYVSYKWLPFSFTLLHLFLFFSASFNPWLVFSVFALFTISSYLARQRVNTYIKEIVKLRVLCEPVYVCVLSFVCNVCACVLHVRVCMYVSLSVRLNNMSVSIFHFT